ncbi:cobalamin biosynthesis family protein [Vibrio natriegens]|uniref:Adenosylcobinamide-phosphate synthase n=1 Tax=Vibrio natriegens NBRC 15636 = ATCC 14048 = DSM 759 TaxID=1219067 RepID=A0AAN1CUW8_VIBNA|nr:cobalamin biosynthesis family protein [Vibrio natriegens]ALR16488.1 adenosylcobinamide-phosphate synthase [Vibrio natriegens NBRC 15636 = ATCC 14048 = DSM 759]ANQ11646.1 adenosylcobinamide-phosphate synthase [Vibrio natriegens NBRC 15636 = ATCC 14048 = DSM 759]EPM39204.1 adenosylcobinamide-phosphate synthase [Vibrio natriegens NBRC 15636 = ATCC 14048 = DSM 759]MDX6025987.1 cobalamin biosynthesis family protein [Vibrio natriegens NBRC 15636 = ATCC 14048 = DSM 759]UUI12098.1 cobalamin biosynt
MEETFQQLYANGALLVMWGALLFHLVLPIPHSAHPFTLWRKIAEQLTIKVNRHHSYSQSILAGCLSILIMILPCLVLLIALKPLVWKAPLYELALLLLALDWRSSERLTKQLVSAMSNEDKPLCRQRLKPYLNRDTNSLSLLGIGKAGAETIIMGYGRNVVCVLFWYALAGGIGAFLYRLIAELARTWSPSRKQYSPFGKPAIQLLAALEIIPLRLFALFIASGKSLSAVMSGISQQAQSWPLPGPAWLLCSVGNKLQLSLGGPAIYQGTRAERAKIGGRIAPSAIHLAQIQALLVWRIFAWIVIQSLLLGLIYQGL